MWYTAKVSYHAVMYFVCIRFIWYWGTEGGAAPPWVSDWAEQKWVVRSCLHWCLYRYIWIDCDVCKWYSLDRSAVRVHPFLAQMFMKWWRRSTTTSRVQLKRSCKASEWFCFRVNLHINMSSIDIHTEHKLVFSPFIATKFCLEHFVAYANIVFVLCFAAMSRDHSAHIIANTTLQTLEILHFSKMNWKSTCFFF